MNPPLSFIVGKRYVLLSTTKGLGRVIMDFDTEGQIDVLTLVTESGAWRLFANGITHGNKPNFVTLSTASWEPESPTKPDLPRIITPKKS